MGRRLPLILALCFASSLTFAGAGAPAPAAALSSDAFFVVQTTDDEYPELQIEIDPDTGHGSPAVVSVDVPAGFELYPDRPPASLVGRGVIYSVDEAYGGSGAARLEGAVVAEPLDAAAESAAQSCSPGEHLALWNLKISLLGEPLDVPIYVSDAKDEPGHLRLDICLPSLPSSDPSAARRLPFSSLQLAIPEYDVPKTPGLYLWRARITPLAPNRRTPLEQKAYELRAVVPRPHILSLRGRYDRHRHGVTLQGKLTAAGRPRAGVRVYFIALDRSVTGGGALFGDRPFGSTRTTQHGTFLFRKKIRKTTGFIAFVEPIPSVCTGPAAPPDGCLSSTTAGTVSDPVTVSVRA